MATNKLNPKEANNTFITGDVRPGAAFRFETKPQNRADATFVALVDGRLIVTKIAVQLFTLPDETPVLANWHGRWRTDAFTTTVAELKVKADEWMNTQ